MSDTDKQPENDPQAKTSGNRPAVMNWIIFIIAALVVAQGAVLAWFYLKL